MKKNAMMIVCQLIIIVMLISFIPSINKINNIVKKQDNVIENINSIQKHITEMVRTDSTINNKLKNYPDILSANIKTLTVKK